jgi:tetratricopeptide (TPR) repeat protein
VWVIGNRVSLSSLRDTYVVVASRRQFDPGSVLKKYNEHLAFWVLDGTEMAYLRGRSEQVVLTDDYAPVENLLTSVVRQGAKERLARRYLRQAAELQNQRDYDQSIAKYRQAVEQNPSMAIKAYNAIGLMRVEQGDLEAAAAAFRRAIAYCEETGLEQAAIASVHMNLGILLRKMGRPTESRTHLTEAVRWFRIDLQQNPRAVHVWDSLGDTLALMGNLKEATEAFEKTVALEPENLAHYQKLSKALEFQKRYDEAIAVVRRQIELLKKQGRRDAALDLGQYVDFLEYQKVKQSN